MDLQISFIEFIITKIFLPKDLTRNLLEFHVVPYKKFNIKIKPNREPNLRIRLDSILIKPEHILLFSSWIDKKDPSHYYTKKNIPYRFRLLYRASRDGYTAEKFHDKCDYKRATVVVTKIQNSEQIVGGYNPLSWNSYSGCMSTNDSFLFSFVNRNNLQSAKMGYVKDVTNAVECYSNIGPAFGKDDLFCYDNCAWSSYSKSYPNIDIPTEFNVDDYEVFKVC